MGWPSGSLSWPNCSVPMLSVVCATISRMSGIAARRIGRRRPPATKRSLESKKQPAPSKRRCYNPPILPVEQKDRRHEQITPSSSPSPSCFPPASRRATANLLPCLPARQLLPPLWLLLHISSCFRTCCRIGCRLLPRRKHRISPWSARPARCCTTKPNACKATRPTAPIQHPPAPNRHRGWMIC